MRNILVSGSSLFIYFHLYSCRVLFAVSFIWYHTESSRTQCWENVHPVHLKTEDVSHVEQSIYEKKNLNIFLNKNQIAFNFQSQRALHSNTSKKWVLGRTLWFYRYFIHSVVHFASSLHLCRSPESLNPTHLYSGVARVWLRLCKRMWRQHSFQFSFWFGRWHGSGWLCLQLRESNGM